MNLEMKSYNNKKFVKRLFFSLPAFILAAVAFIYSDEKNYLFTASIVLFVLGAFNVLAAVWHWKIAKSVLNNSSMKISNIKELNDACEKMNDERLNSYVDRAQKYAEIK